MSKRANPDKQFVVHDVGFLLINRSSFLGVMRYSFCYRHSETNSFLSVKTAGVSFAANFSLVLWLSCVFC